MNTIQAIDYQVDLLRVVLWQYSDAQNLQEIINRKQQWYNRNYSQFWQDWFRDVFDLKTANDFGLSVWAKILDFPISVETTESPTDFPAWGFSDTVGADDSPISNFSNGNFATPGDELEGLTTEQKRFILRLRFYSLFSDLTVTSINAALQDVFGDENYVYVLDNNDMTITYVFSVIPDSKTLFLIENFDLLPRPSGVSYDVRIVPQVSFGFDDHRQNFDRGNFLSLIGLDHDEEP